MGTPVPIRRLALFAIVCLLGPASARAAAPFAEPMITLTLDDGFASQFMVARPTLQQHHFPVTYFLITNAIRDGWGGYMTQDQVRTLLSEGNEVQSHTLTHPDLTTLTAAQLTSELADSQSWLVNTFSLPSVSHFASPYGQYNANVLSAIGTYYTSHRTQKLGRTFVDTSLLELRSSNAQSNVSVDTVKSWIDQTVLEKSWLILTFHEFVTGAPSASTQYNINDFNAILDYIAARGIKVVTLTDGVRLRASAPPDTSPHAYIYGDALGNDVEDWSWATRNFRQSQIVHDGTSAIAFEPDNWGGLMFHGLAGYDTTPYKTLELWVHGGTTGSQKAQVTLRQGNTVRAAVSLESALGHPVLAGQWQRVSLSLAALGLSSVTLSDITLEDTSGADQGTLYVDGIQFVTTDTAPPPPPPPPPPAPVLNVYLDALGTGFEDWSWATHSLAQTSVVHDGTKAASFKPSSWAALYFHYATGINAASYSTLELWVHGGTTGGQKVNVVLMDGNTQLGSVSLSTVLGHPLRAGTWDKAVVNLSGIGVSSGTIRDIYLQDSSGTTQGTVYVDTMVFQPR